MLPPEPSNVAIGQVWPRCEETINPIHIGLPQFRDDPTRHVGCFKDAGHAGPHAHLDKQWQV